VEIEMRARQAETEPAVEAPTKVCVNAGYGKAEEDASA
jgi:hypothetical protein